MITMPCYCRECRYCRGEIDRATYDRINPGRHLEVKKENAYTILCEAREHLGKAHDKISTAVMNYSGGHQQHLIGVCPEINDLIEKLNDACGEEADHATP